MSTEKRAKLRTDLLIGAALIFQLVVPATYYLRDEPYDERFAWRMFSAIRVQGCEVQVLERRGESEVQVNLPQEIHTAWITNLERNRRDVALALLRRRCEEEAVTAVRIVTSCVGADEQPREPIEIRRDCASGEVEGP